MRILKSFLSKVLFIIALCTGTLFTHSSFATDYDCPTFSSTWESGPLVEMPSASYDFDDDGEISSDECFVARVYGLIGHYILNTNDSDLSSDLLQLKQLAQTQNTYTLNNSLNAGSGISFAFCRYNEKTRNYDLSCTPAINMCEGADDLQDFSSLGILSFSIDYMENILDETIPPAYYGYMFTQDSDDISFANSCADSCEPGYHWDVVDGCMPKDDAWCENEYGAGYYWDGSNCSQKDDAWCENEYGSDHYWDNPNCSPKDNTYCENEYGSDHYWNGTNCSQKDDTYCDTYGPDYYWDGSNCSQKDDTYCENEYGAGYYWDGEECVWYDPSDDCGEYEYWDGLDCVFDGYAYCENEYGAGYYWDGSDCSQKDDTYCENEYRSDYYWDGSDCSQKDDTYCENAYGPDYYWDGSNCSQKDETWCENEYGSTYGWDGSNCVLKASNSYCQYTNNSNYYWDGTNCSQKDDTWCESEFNSTYGWNGSNCVLKTSDSYIQWTQKFTLVTTSTNTFSFKISATGDFTVDCGDGGTLSGTGVSGNTITRSDTTAATYTCSYSTSAPRTIKFSGLATGYSTDTSTAAITFYLSGNGDYWTYNDDNCALVSAVYGDLSAIFPVLGSGSGQKPRFYQTFRGASNLTYISPDLFAHITTGTSYMFYQTFQKNVSLTEIPDGLFSRITTGGEQMFRGTFLSCSGLLRLPENLFSGLTAAQDTMFRDVFHSCSSVSGYIPASMFSGLISNGSPYARDMFHYAFVNDNLLDTSCPANTYKVTTDYENYWHGHVACSVCPNNGTSPAGSTSVNACVSAAPSSTISLSWYAKDGDTQTYSTSMCTVGDTITLPETPVRPGYTFVGWTVQTNNE